MPQTEQIVEYRVAERPVKQNEPYRITLAELIVIIAIIAVLAAIIFPVFAKRTRCDGGGRPVCQSNLKQIGMAIMQYSQDYNEEYPRLAVLASTSTVGPGSIASWRQVLYPYLQTRAVFKCTHNPIRDSISPFDGYPQSYDVTDIGPIRLDRIVYQRDVSSPATTIMVFEENGDTPQAQQIGVSWNHDSGEDGWTNILYPGHYGGSNYLYCDGHVKWQQPMGAGCWSLDRTQVSPRALAKLRAAERNFADN